MEMNKNEWIVHAAKKLNQKLPKENEIVIHGEPPVVNLSEVRVRRCAKCGIRSLKVQRHHKGHEYLLAKLRPEYYAKRYMQFHVDDTVYLCGVCHLEIHDYYAPVIQEWMKKFVEPRMQRGKQALKNDCDRLRQRLINLCNRWLEGKEIYGQARNSKGSRLWKKRRTYRSSRRSSWR